MKVLHLVKTAVGGTWALRQMRELAGHGIEVHVALPSGGTLNDQYKAAGIVTHELDIGLSLSRPWQLPRSLHQFRELVSSVQPDIIHSHFVQTTATMRLALGKEHPIPRMFQVPGPLHLEHALFRKSDLWTSGSNDYWIASCRWTQDCYKSAGVPDDHLFLSYYGTDFDQFADRTPGKLRNLLEVSASTIIVGMVGFMYAPKKYLGQIRGIKGHEDLIDAVALCYDKGYEFLPVFVGGPWGTADKYEKKVQEYAAAKLGDRVVFLGTRNDVLDLYPDFTIAAFPSHSENIGGAGEATLMGVPTIATNVGGFPDIIHNGETGLLVPPKDPHALADAIMYMIDNPNARNLMAANGQFLAKSLFDAKKTSQQVTEIYQMISNRVTT